MAVTNGSFHGHAIRDDGSLWGWGMGAWYAVGDGVNTKPDGTANNVHRPVKVGEGFWKTTVGGGNNNGFAIKFDGAVWAWGGNVRGMLGNGGTEHVPTPTPIGFNVYSPTGLDAEVLAWGAPTKRTLVASVAPNQADAGQPGCMFAAAQLADGSLYTLSADGWQLHRPSQARAWQCGRLSAQEFDLVRDADLSGLRGLQVYLGYGRGSSPTDALADMLARSWLRHAHTE
ncbi:hypothetical protein [Inhella sp.]|uniref:hypothetical protein n=1 Tax=Inhella sp. TaxID=1921806 RepID=UPI0035B342AF